MREDDRLKGSEARLWRLIEARCHPDADTREIDRRIWDLFGATRAITFTDLSGFGRRSAEFGILHFLQVIHEHRQLLTPVIEAHDGILVKVEADSLLIVHRRVDAALACAIEMQRACQRTNARRKVEEQILLCAGIGYGPMLCIGDIDVYGEQVNAASKLGEDIARADEILVTSAARDTLGDLPDVTFTDLEQSVAGSERNYRVGYARAT